MKWEDDYNNIYSVGKIKRIHIIYGREADTGDRYGRPIRETDTHPF
jgi:hypothetical protein